MATATVARPAQALRNRRDAPRPTLPLKRASAMDASAEPGGKKRKLNEPHVITKAHILKKFKDRQPSLTVHLHQTHWKFEGQEGSFAYDSPMRAFLQHLRKSTLPHDMLEELLTGNIPFYDGCLIVEVHNHRSANGKEKGKRDSAAGDQVRYSMHNYNSYVTPSPFAPYPKKAKEHEPPTNEEGAKADEQNKTKEGKGKDKEGPHITTEVMFPTPLSRHKEMLILANTPASEMRSKKRSTDGATPSSAQPPTPQLAVPPTLGGKSPGSENKMCLEDSEVYQFEAETLITTQPPLYLDPVKDPQEAQKVLDMLSHPLHNDLPPSPKTRKRTTAEMAADDAQAAEAERRMLIMDERIKAASTGDTAGTAQAFGFSRFKTIQMVRENHEEQERKKKEEEAQAAAQRRHQEMVEAKEKEQKALQAEQHRQLMNRRQHQARQAHEMRLQSQQALLAQNQAQQNGMMPNQHQGNFQHPASVSQASPVVRQQTPMMNSSPMLQQGGFPMTATSSQQAGSPPRPTSAAMPNPSVAMARQVSQQHASRNATPQMAQGTPNLGGQMPNRQVSQTPRMAHGSPAPGTPAAVGMPNMNMGAQNGMTPEQFAILQAQQRQMSQSQGGAMNAGSPGQQGQMTPEQFQSITQQQRQRMQQQMQQQMLMARQQGANPQQIAQLEHRNRALMMQQQQQMMQQRMMAQQNSNQGQSPHPGMQQNPNQGFPQQGGMQQGQQPTPEQMHARQQMQLKQAQQQLQQLHHQYSGLQNVPQQVAHSLPQPVQILLRQQQQRQQAARAQQMAMRAQQAQSAGQPVAGSGNADPEYMQTLRNHQAMLAQQQAQQNGQGGQMGGMGMGHNMNFNNMQNQQFGGQGQGNDLSASFQAMQAALNRGNQQGGQH